MPFLVGQIVRISVTFTDGANPPVLTDPTSTVTLVVQSPDNTQTTYDTPAHDSTGKYHQDIPTDTTGPGLYLFRWDGEGTISALREGSFRVDPTALVPQPVTPAAAPPEFTQADLIAIDKAIAGGASSVQFADRKVEYSSMRDLMQARELILDYLGQSAVPQRRQIRIFTGSGW